MVGLPEGEKYWLENSSFKLLEKNVWASAQLSFPGAVWCAVAQEPDYRWEKPAASVHLC